MYKYIKIIIIIFIILGAFYFAIFTVGSYFFSDLFSDTQVYGKNEDQSGMASLGTETPYFNLVSTKGSRVSRSDLKGEPFMVTFWTTWSPESVDQIKILDDYINDSSLDQKNSKIRMLLVNNQENQKVVSNFVKRGGYDVEVLLDESGEAGNNYGIKTLPTTFFVGSDGSIKEIFVGTMNRSMLVDKIENLLK